MNKDEILIIKPDYPVKKTDMPIVYRNMLDQMKNGLVLLPFGYEAVIVPKDVELKLGPDKDEEKVIHNAVTYICMADKNNHGTTADQIAKVLYDRAYRKGFEAGKAEGKKEGRVKVKEVYVKDEVYHYNGGL